VIAGSALMALVGLVAGILAEKFDHLAALTNFVVTPLSFLSGTFYSIEVLPPAMQATIQMNPIFYLIDGMRHAALGQGDADPAFGIVLVMAVNLALALVAWRWLRSGYRLKT
jgi:ABC-2 type transport system permease protein